jgi:hypothetical protein
VNQLFASTLGYLTSELEGTHVELITDYHSKGGMIDFKKMIAGELTHFEQEKLYRKKCGEKISAKVQSFPIFQDGATRVGPEEVLYSFSVVLFENHNKTTETVIRSLEARIKANETQQRSTNTLIQALIGMQKEVPKIVINNDNQNDNQGGEQHVEH